MKKNTKKIIEFLCSVAFCTAVAVNVPQTANAASVAINETNFPDGIFRNYVSGTFDKNNDGVLSQKEIARATSIEISHEEIKSLKGVEYFTALTVLNCSYNQLTTLDVSNNKALAVLSCHSNRLITLDVSNNKALTVLNCYNNQLAILDVSNNTALIKLDCESNKLTTLDLNNNTALTDLHLYYSGNQIKTLVNVSNVSNVAINETNFPDEIFRSYVVAEFDKDNNGTLSEKEIAEVDEIDISNLGIESLKGVESFTTLTSLNCESNKLTTLDLSNNKALASLNCSENQLTTLDISSNRALTELNCYSNQLATLDVSNNMALAKLDCYSNQLTTLDVSNNTILTNLNCYSNQLTTLDVSNNTILTNLNCYSNQLTTLDVSNNTILTNLNCYSNQLTTLDASKKRDLTELRCESNQLKVLDVSNNTALKELNCSYNQLTTLDLSKNMDLKVLNCSYNQLTTLNLSNNTALKELHCYSNQLKVLDVSNNTSLTELYCHNNQFTILDLNNNTALITLHYSNSTTLNIGNYTALKYFYCYSNKLTTLTYYNQTSSIDTLLFDKATLHGLDTSLSDLQNVTITDDVIQVTNITKPATYKVNGKDFKIVYTNALDNVLANNLSVAETKGKPELENKTITLKKGQQARIKIISKLNTSVTYKSLAPSVATVSKDGIVTAKKNGKATITVKINEQTRKVKVTVKSK